MSATPSPSHDTGLQGGSDVTHPFQPPWMLRNGHMQTLAGAYFFGRWPDRDFLPAQTETIGEVILEDGDSLAFVDDCPPEWSAGDPVVLLCHGLAGSHDSPYMRRIALQLYHRKIRSIRLNWRGCGAGVRLARYPYHSGRTEDLQAVIRELHRRFGASPVSLIGFSMGGNVALKYLGEVGAVAGGQSGVVRAVAVCPPINLSATIDSLNTGLASWYNSYFAKVCIKNVRQRQRVRPDAIVPEGWFSRLPRNMRDFDETFTAPICGFASARDYYVKCSANQFLPAITTPTLIVGAQDDPVIPYQPFLDAQLSPSTQLIVSRHGGHLGFVSGGGSRWVDQTVIDWALGLD